VAASDLLDWAEQLDALAKQLSEEWHARQVRKSGMTPDELRQVGVADWDLKFIKQNVEPRYQAAGKILESVWRNHELEADAVFGMCVSSQRSEESDAKRHREIFFRVRSFWLPSNREPGWPIESTPVVDDCVAAIQSCAKVLRRRALNVVTGEQAAIDRLNQQNAWRIGLPSDAMLPNVQLPVAAPNKNQGRRRVVAATSSTIKSNRIVLWHDSSESPPNEYPAGPLIGTKAQLVKWILRKSDHRLLRTSLKKGTYWGREDSRTQCAVWFKTPERYAEANAQRLAHPS